MVKILHGKDIVKSIINSDFSTPEIMESVIKNGFENSMRQI